MSHFNDQAKEWDSEEKIIMMKTLAQKTMAVLHLKEKLDIMDFGCGTGLFGLEFTDYAKSLLGIDTSEGMLEVFNKKTKGHDHIRSLLIDLENNTIKQKFDLIISSMAFHHLNHPAQMIQKLKSLLNPHGRLAIVDLDQEDGTFHPDNKKMGVKHYGFSQEKLSAWAKTENMKLSHQIINYISKNNQKYGQFLAVFE